MDAYRVMDAYVEGFLTLIREGHDDQVRDVLLARLNGTTGEVWGLVSPSLALDEPDRLALLYHIYQRLKNEEHEGGISCFHRVLVGQYCETLCQSELPLIRLDELARLVAFCEVADSFTSAESLLLTLWGYLTSKLPKPLDQIITLPPQDMERAGAVLGLWMAIVQEGCSLTEPHIAVIRQALKNTLKIIKNNKSQRTPEKIEMLLLLYRAAVKIMPKEAAKDYFSEISALAQDSDNPFLLRWQGICWRYSYTLEKTPRLKSIFIDGLKEYISNQRQLLDHFKTSLSFLGLDSVADEEKKNNVHNLTESRDERKEILARTVPLLEVA